MKKKRRGSGLDEWTEIILAKGKDAIDTVTEALDDKPDSKERQEQIKYMVGITKERLEYWHEQLNVFLKEMGLPPPMVRDRVKRRQWNDVLEGIGDLKVRIRLLHGEWAKTESFRNDTDNISGHKAKRTRSVQILGHEVDVEIEEEDE